MGLTTPELSLQAEGLSFVSAADKLGIKDFNLALQVDGAVGTVAWADIATTDRGATATGRHVGEMLTVELSVERLGERAIVVRHVLRNDTARTLRLRDIHWGIQSADGALQAGKTSGWNLRYCHTDNVRTERYPYCQPETAYVRSLPTRPLLLGIGEDQPFPAVYVTQRSYATGVVVGAATQAFGYQSFEILGAPQYQKSAFAVFRVQHELTMADGYDLAPGATLALDGTYVEVLTDTHPQAAYDAYVDYLTTTHDFYGPKTPLLTEALHCTWNYGVFDKQYEPQLLETAAFIARELPGIRTFLMDAGYVSKPDKHSALSRNFCDRFYPEPNACVDREKFPDGVAAYTAKLREMGLKPGIWWSPTARVDSQLYADHPDWYVRRADGSLYVIAGENGFLDLTLPAVQDYIDRTLAVVVGEWGMTALKMDFWSHMAEDRDIRLATPGQTGVAARTRLFEIVRKHLGPDGVFVTCVATGMGNPFIGQWADSYRNTIDIGVGVWQEQIMNCIWALPTLLQPGRKTFLLNNDSIGVDPGSSDDENYFRFTWMHMNMGLMETGGEMQKWDPKWVAAMRKITDRLDRGWPVRCPDERAFTGEPLPESLVVDYPADSITGKLGVRQNLAFFNWTDEPALISVPRASLGHSGPVTAENFWTGEREIWDGEFVTQRLAPHAAALYDVLAE